MLLRSFYQISANKMHATIKARQRNWWKTDKQKQQKSKQQHGNHLQSRFVYLCYNDKSTILHSIRWICVYSL